MSKRSVVFDLTTKRLLVDGQPYGYADWSQLVGMPPAAVLIDDTVHTIDLTLPELDSRVTFTRASSKTYFGSDGTLQTAAADVWPLEYDPVTLQPVGRSVWGQRTNLLLRSNAFPDSYWTKTNVATDSVADPVFGTAVRITDTDSGAVLRRVFRSAVAPEATTCAYSIFLKAGTRAFAWVGAEDGGISSRRVAVNLETGAVVASGASVSSIRVDPVGGGWFRVSFSAPGGTTAAEGAFAFGPAASNGSPSSAGDGTGTIYAAAAQLEAAAFPSPYIPTGASSVTRAADSAQVLDLSTLGYRQDEGTLYVDGVGGVNNGAFATLRNAASNAYSSLIQPLSGPAIRGLSRADGASQGSVTITIPAGVVGVRRRIAHAFRAGDFGLAVDGVASAPNATGILPADVAVLQIGSFTATGLHINGPLRRIRYIPRRLSAAELQAITSPDFEWHTPRPNWAHITGKPDTFPPSAHTHAAADVVSGRFPRERLPVLLDNFVNTIQTDSRFSQDGTGPYHLFTYADPGTVTSDGPRFTPVQVDDALLPGYQLRLENGPESPMGEVSTLVLRLDTPATNPPNRVIASPTDATGAVSVRQLVPDDIPTLPTGKISGSFFSRTMGEEPVLHGTGGGVNLNNMVGGQTWTVNTTGNSNLPTWPGVDWWHIHTYNAWDQQDRTQVAWAATGPAQYAYRHRTSDGNWTAWAYSASVAGAVTAGQYVRAATGDARRLEGRTAVQVRGDIQAANSAMEAGFVRGFKITRTGNNTVSVSSGVAHTQAGILAEFGGAASVPIGSAANTWYHLYFDGTGIVAVTTVPATTPYSGTARSASTDTSLRYIGSVRTNASGVLWNFQHDPEMNEVWWLEDTTAAPFRVISAGTATTKTTVSAGQNVAPNVVTRKLWVSALAVTTNTGRLYFDILEVPLAAGAGYTYVNGLASGNEQVYIPLVVNISRQFRYSWSTAPAGANAGAYVDVIGYTFER